VAEIRRIKPPTKAANDPNSKITAPGDMLIFINGVAPIYGVQSLYFLNDTLLARTKLKPPAFPTAAVPSLVKPAEAATSSLDIAAIAHAAVADQAIEEQIRGNT
jgi:type IV secretion system protein VirD4